MKMNNSNQELSIKCGKTTNSFEELKLLCKKEADKLLKTIDVSSVEHEEGEYCEIDVEYNCSPEDFDKLRYLARSGVRKQGRSFSKIAERKRQKAISKMFG